MLQCPICKSDAEEVEPGMMEGIGFDCKQDGRFRISRTVIAMMEAGREWPCGRWENALEVAKRAADPGKLPMILSYYL
jgi:hypothetical protein